MNWITTSTLMLSLFLVGACAHQSHQTRSQKAEVRLVLGDAPPADEYNSDAYLVFMKPVGGESYDYVGAMSYNEQIDEASFVASTASDEFVLMVTPGDPSEPRADGPVLLMTLCEREMRTIEGSTRALALECDNVM